jgi:3-oxoadipate enol-lactonase/4-carboxymuconolactone decarboxylase
LCDTAAKIGTAELWQERADTLRQHGMAYLGQAIVSRWFGPDFIERNPAVYHGYLNMLTRMPVEGYAGTCEALRDGDLTETIRRIKAPTLVLCGAEDMATPPDVVKSLCDLLPQAHYGEISGAAHLPCTERPEETAALIAEFLREDKFEQGMNMRRSVLGDDHVERAEANTTPFDADFQAYIVESVWGSIWSRPGLDKKTRHLLTIAMLAALGKEHELSLHIQATENTGVTRDEVKEVLLQVGVYAGIPAANSAFAVAKRLYTEMDGGRPTTSGQPTATGLG